MVDTIHAASLVLAIAVDYDSGVIAGDYDDNAAADLGTGEGVAHHYVEATTAIDRADLRGLTIHEVGPLRPDGRRRDSAGGGNSHGAIMAMLARVQREEMADLEAIIEDGSFSALARGLGEDELELLGSALVEVEHAAWAKVVARLDELAEVDGDDDGDDWEEDDEEEEDNEEDDDGDDWEDDDWEDGDDDEEEDEDDEGHRVLLVVNPEWYGREDHGFQTFIPCGAVLGFGGVA